MNVIGEAISRKWFTEFRTSHMNTDVYETSGSSKEREGEDKMSLRNVYGTRIYRLRYIRV